tara:strand:+ start:134 stop:1072 length:939 start_codon:yes stop_codon:yes gene_type:complete
MQKRVRKDYDWYEVLVSLGIEPPVGEDQFNILCTLHDDSRISMSLNVEEGKWICYTGCGAGSIFTLVKRMKDLSTAQTEDYMEAHGGYKLPNISELFYEKAVAEDINAPLPEVTFPFEMGRIPKWIYGRGYSVETLLRWEIGVDTNAGLAIPIRDTDRRMVGWVVRKRVGEPKYLYLPDMKKSRVLYGEYNLPEEIDTLYVCEGSLDTMWLDQLGYNAVGLLGASISDAQVKRLANLKAESVVLVLDNDEAGLNGTRKALTKLKEYGIVKYVQLPKYVNDIQDIRDADAVREALANKYSWVIPREGENTWQD